MTTGGHTGDKIGTQSQVTLAHNYFILYCAQYKITVTANGIPLIHISSAVAKEFLDDNIFYSPCKFDANRYVARSLSFDIVEIKDSFNNTKMFSDFVKIVNSQSNAER